VRRELEATDAVRGNADAVREFVFAAAQRLQLYLTRDTGTDAFQIAEHPDVFGQV
jgi:hypothetical protein